jgi:hypothetical protein
MRYWKVIVLAPAIMIAAGCGRGDDRAAADSALNSDLNLANQVAPYGRVDSIEAGLTAAPVVAPRALTSTPARTTTRRSTTTRRASSSSSASSGASSTSAGTVTTSSGGEVVVQKNTKRDAAIGAAAGAVIGATTSKDKLKGAVIGGVVGGVLGGVIGNNVDVKKTKRPPQ